MANPVALITGAARRLGAETARTLHQRGMRVIIHYRNSASDADALVEELNGIRAQSACAVQADLDSPDQVRTLADTALQKWGRLDLLVNNASSFYPTPMGKSTDEDWTRLVNSNLRAPYILTESLAPALAEHNGCIINIIDVYAEKPLAQHTLYCMAKAGLAMLTRSSARELGPDVRVNGVAPGPILWPEQGQDNQSSIIAATALKRCGAPADIAAMVTFLALDAPYVTGQIVAVDGGRSLGFQGG
ncbi:MAG: pteridine reductase [Alcanivoracaceae bacterium]|nr:pteridine reductase [Alcanivoracaceae bacterium]